MQNLEGCRGITRADRKPAPKKPLLDMYSFLRKVKLKRKRCEGDGISDNDPFLCVHCLRVRPRFLKGTQGYEFWCLYASGLTANARVELADLAQ